MAFRNVALFGANGQIGNYILHELLNCSVQQFYVTAFIPPWSTIKLRTPATDLTSHQVDLTKVSVETLTPLLEGVDVVISAVGSTTLPYQQVIQDAAARANVSRFYPSEFGMHQVHRFGEERTGFIHHVWDLKMRCLEDALGHSAIREGKMTYTVIGCSDNYDAPRETLLNPWLNPMATEYTIHVVGDPDAKMDYTSVRDIAAYLVASICNSEASKNKILAFSGDYISFGEVAQLLRKHTGRKVTISLTTFDEAERMIRHPELAPAEFKEGSAFPADFIVALRYAQGRGRMCRAPGQTQNHLFKDIQVRSVDQYFSEIFGNAM